ncbi:MAG: hypothetical protein ABJI62_18520, partial [Alphaproteobacteria bacterium]
MTTSGHTTAADRAPSAPFRVMFVHAPDPVYSNTQTYGAIFMPVWAYTLAAHIPDDLDVDLMLHDTRVQKVDDIPEADIY